MRGEYIYILGATNIFSSEFLIIFLSKQKKYEIIAKIFLI